MVEQVDALSDERKPIGEDDLAKILDQAKAEKTKLEAERNAATARAEHAERGRTEIATKLVGETEARFVAQESAVENAIRAAQTDADRLESAVATLNAEGKFVEAAKASRELGTAAAKLANLENHKTWLSGQKEQIKRQPPPQQKPPDPLEGYTSTTRAWIQAHPQFMDESSAYHKKAMKGHYDALDRGAAQDSTEYWQIVEEHTGDRQVENLDQDDEGQVEDLTAEPVRPAPRKVVDVAPVTRRAAPGKPPAQSKNEMFNLSADERDAADAIIRNMDGSEVPPAERYKRYYEGKQMAKAKGLMN